jgi:biopolymer transport protein ExbB
MSAIAEALVATAVGLAVAIPAVAAYNFYQRHTRSVLGNTDALSNVLLAHLSGEEKPTGARSAKAKANEDD